MSNDNAPVDWRQVHERLFQLRDQGMSWEQVGEQIEHIFGLDRPRPRVHKEKLNYLLRRRSYLDGELTVVGASEVIMELLYPTPSEGANIHFKEPLVVPEDEDDPIVFTLHESQLPTLHLNADQEKWLDEEGRYVADVISPLCNNPERHVRMTEEQLVRQLAVERAVAAQKAAEQEAREAKVRAETEHAIEEMAPVLYQGRKLDQLDKHEYGVVVRAVLHMMKLQGAGS